jgi:hypothetical protein
LTRPLSITNSTSSTVIEVSAMLVASTTLRQPGGAWRKTADCSCDESDECSGSSSQRPARAENSRRTESES